MKVLSPIAVAVGILALTLSAGAAPDREKKDAKDEVKKLDGEWDIVSWTQGGEALPAEGLEGARWTINGEKYTFKLGGAGEDGKIKVDTSKKPATFDLAIESGNDKDKGQPGIFKFDGDDLVICLARPGGTGRPTEFKSTEDGDTFIIATLKRHKKDD